MANDVGRCGSGWIMRISETEKSRGKLGDIMP